MKKWTAPSLALAALLAASTAQADIPAGPCDLANPGDSCVTEADEAGTCVEDGNVLVCEPNGGSGGSSGATTSGATTGGGPAPAPAPAPETEDDGCAVSAPGKAGSPWAVGALALVALGAGLSLRRRR